jgi:hypothetical protein
MVQIHIRIVVTGPILTVTANSRSNRYKGKGRLAFLYSLPFQIQQLFKDGIPVIAVAISCIVLSNGAFESKDIILCLLWIIGICLGVNFRKLKRKFLHKNKYQQDYPSWTIGILLGVGCAIAAFYITKDYLYINDMALLALSVNIVYLGAKFRCRISRCCEAVRPCYSTTLLQRADCYLQEFEFLITLLIIIISLLLWVQYGSYSAVLFAFFMHGLLRGYSWYLRMPNRSKFQCFFDIGSLGFGIIGVLLSMIGQG